MRPSHRIRALVLVLTVAACGTSTVSSAGPTAEVGSPLVSATAPAPTTQATNGPEPTDGPAATADPAGSLWAQDPPMPLLVRSAVRVTVDKLNVRDRPSTSARELGTVTEGNILTFRGAPIEADGYIWYPGFLAWSSIEHVPALPAPMVDVGDPLGGWFATSKGVTSYVALIEPRCPDDISLANVAAMLGAERLACFGGSSIEVQGTYGCSPCDAHIFGEFEPPWLTNPNDVRQFLWDVPMEGQGLLLRFPPVGPIPPEGGQIIRVEGHFRDDAAVHCALALAYPWTDGFDFHVIGATVARQLCRQEFVVESYDVLGTDPRFPVE